MLTHGRSWHLSSSHWHRPLAHSDWTGMSPHRNTSGVVSGVVGGVTSGVVSGTSWHCESWTLQRSDGQKAASMLLHGIPMQVLALHWHCKAERAHVSASKIWSQAEGARHRFSLMRHRGNGHWLTVKAVQGASLHVMPSRAT